MAVSLAVARAGAAEKNIPLYKYISHFAGRAKGDKYITPVPSLNVINGGYLLLNLIYKKKTCWKFISNVRIYDFANWIQLF